MTDRIRTRRIRFAGLCGLLLLFLAPLRADKKEPDLDVPFEPTPPQVVEEMLKLAAISSSDYVFDLGCGDGRILIAAAKQYGARGFGVDLDPQRIEECKENAEAAGVADKLTFVQGDIFDQDLRPATALTMYLLDEINLKLRPKCFRELQPGVRIVSHAFNMADWKADKEVNIPKARNDVIYLWIIPAPVGGIWEWSEKTASGAIPMRLTLTQEFQTVQGALTAGQGKPNRVRDISLTGRDIAFSAQFPEGKRLTRVAFKGRVDGDTIKGTRQAGKDAPQEWTAQRKPADLTGAWRIQTQNSPEPLDGVLHIERKNGQLAAKYAKGTETMPTELWHFYVWGTSVYFEVPAPDGDEDERGVIFTGVLDDTNAGGRLRKEGWSDQASWTAARGK